MRDAHTKINRHLKYLPVACSQLYYFHLQMSVIYAHICWGRSIYRANRDERKNGMRNNEQIGKKESFFFLLTTNLYDFFIVCSLSTEHFVVTILSSTSQMFLKFISLKILLFFYVNHILDRHRFSHCFDKI